MSVIKDLGDLASFQKIQDKMVATSDTFWSNSYSYTSGWNQKIKNYTIEEVAAIINSGSRLQQQILSQNYFYKDGLYRRIITYYATLLKYTGLVIPNSDKTKNLSTPGITKKYNKAVDFVEDIKTSTLFTEISYRVLVNGIYYGIILSSEKNNFVLMDLPFSYCRTRMKDWLGNDIIEFNVSYFDSISDDSMKEYALKVYPKVITSYYRKWVKGTVSKNDPWIIIPAKIGVCFQLFDGRPFFLSVIPAAINYDNAVETERERDLEEIRKIIVQKIPHLTDGGLLFEPLEAAEIHKGTVGMMRGNKNVSVLTTYADVDAIVSNTSNDSTKNNLEKNLQNVYSEAGTTSQLFAATGNLSIETSIKNDTALMMVLGNKYSNFISFLLNDKYGNSSISFKYSILDITYYNESTYISDALKLAQNGYSYILPALAMGISQRDLINIKEIENNVYKLGEQLIPLKSSYTQSSADVGRPRLPDDQKSDKTIANEISLDAQGGSE